MNSEEQNRNMQQILDASLTGIREFSSVQNSFGQPIVTPSGMTVIPVSRISIGFATGGIGMPKRKIAADADGFGGGGGSGVSVTPIAYLTVSSDQNVRLIPVSDPGSATTERVIDLIEHAPQIGEKLKKTFFG